MSLLTAYRPLPVAAPAPAVNVEPGRPVLMVDTRMRRLFRLDGVVLRARVETAVLAAVATSAELLLDSGVRQWPSEGLEELWQV